jgi:hypothetical protein
MITGHGLRVSAALGILSAVGITQVLAQSSLPPCPTLTNTSNRLDNCQGAYTDSNGARYVGEFQEGKPDGQGTATFRDGRKYVGEFREGKWRDGKRNGKGTYTHPDGSKYVGEFRDGKFDGQGTFTYSDGRKYVGEWREGKRTGQGTETSADGKLLTGEFRDGLLNGQGSGTLSNGKTYVGEWRDGLPHGRGTETLPNGVKYVGEFLDGKYSGQGTFTTAGHAKYVGEFRDGTQNGQGTYTFNGSTYVGDWQDGRENGHGTLTLPNGAKYIGTWQANKKHGQGKEYSSNGELVREGYWISDEYYGPKAPAGLRIEDGARVKMIESGGVYHVPVLINDALKLDFIVDSGASDLTIPADVVLTLIRTGTIKEADFIGTQRYVLADGSAVSSGTFTIRSLKVGDRIITDVRASIADVNGSLLLGQSFLNKFKSWSQDNTTHELVLQ